MNKINAQKTKDMVIIGLMAAIICVMGPLSIRLPFTLVPISLTNLAIYFILYVAGTRRTVISYLIYLLIGMCGVPVFSNFSSGVQKLAGPTGGYLVGFIFMAMVSGFFIDRWYNKPVIAFAGMWLGKAVQRGICVAIWCAYVAGLSFKAALMGGVVPFLLGDLIKTILVAAVGPAVRKRLAVSGLVEYSVNNSSI
ncbi:MAG: biotin transporter BioY [Lachnospira sp.]